MTRHWLPFPESLPLCALRQVISARGPLLTLRVHDNLWVLRAGSDPRAWVKKVDPAGRGISAWKHARVSFERILRPIEIIARAERAILTRLRNQLSYSRRLAREAWQLGGDLFAADAEPERMLAETVPHLVRAWPQFDRQVATWEELSRELPQNARHAYARLRDANSLLRRLHALTGWLDHFPPDALAFVERHGFVQQRWALLNLWMRVPEGRELFDEIPFLAAMLAGWWRFRPHVTHPMRTIRRLVRRSRNEILAWLDLPTGSGTLKLLSTLPGSAATCVECRNVVHSLRDPSMRSWLLNLGVPLNPDILRAAQPGAITFPILNAIAHGEYAGPVGARMSVRELYFDLIGMIVPEDGLPLLVELPRVRSKERLWQLHERAIHFRNQHSRRDELHWTDPIPPPFAPEPWMHPLQTLDELEQEGRAMSHCVASYAERILAGDYYAYAIEHLTGRATLGIERIGDSRWCLDQLRGPSNATPSSALAALLEAWLEACGLDSDLTALTAGECVEDDIPF